MNGRFRCWKVWAVLLPFCGPVFAQPPPPWNGLGPVVFRVTLPTTAGDAWEPLLSLGTAGAGDVVFCRRLADGQFVFGWEQLGRAAALSDPVSVRSATDHEVLISLGSQLPPEEQLANPAFAKLRGLALVQCDGHTVLIANGNFNPTKQPAVLGRNPIGGALAQAFFSGRIEAVAPADLRSVLNAAINPSRLITEDRSVDSRTPEFPGPLKLRVMFPGGGAGHNQPLVTAGITGYGDIVYVRYENDRALRIGFDHWRVGGPLSEPLECDIGVPHEIIVSMGSFLPPLVAGQADPPQIAALRERCVILLDGKLVFATSSKFYPTTAEQITLFTNLIGGSTADAMFTGTILRIERVKPEDILRAAKIPPR